MKNSSDSQKSHLNLPEPTKEQIQHVKKMAQDKYDVVLPEADAVKLVNLINELDWWQKTDKYTKSSRFSGEQLNDLRDLLEQVSNEEVSKSEVYDQAQALLTLVPLKEKQRISDEIRAIIVEHREVPYEPVVVEKLVKLVKLQYDVTLSEDQLEQAIPFLTKTLWYEEGLDDSLEKCLDDLLIYVDKVKRGKRVNNLPSHDEMRKTLDKVILKLIGS